MSFSKKRVISPHVYIILSHIERYIYSFPIKCENFSYSIQFREQWYKNYYQNSFSCYHRSSLQLLAKTFHNSKNYRSFRKVSSHIYTFDSFKVYTPLGRCSRHFDKSRRQLANISKLPLVNTRDADLPIFTLQLDTTALSLFKISATQAVPPPFLFHGNTRCQVQGRLFVPLGLVREAKAISYLCLCEPFHLPAEVAGSVSRLIVTVVVEVPKGSSRLQG